MFAGVAIALGAGCQVPPPITAPQPVAAEDSIVVKYQIATSNLVAELMQKLPALRRDPAVAPAIAIGAIVNASPYDVQTRSLVEEIRDSLIAAGAAHFVELANTRDERTQSLRTELEIQGKSGEYDPATVKRYGKAIGADYVLLGQVFSIEDPAVGQVHFKYQLSLHSVEKRDIVWGGSQLLTQRRP